MGVSYDVANKEWSFTKDPLLARKTVNYPKKRYMNVKYKKARVDRNRYEPWNIEASISTTAGPNKEGLETTKESRWGDVVDYMVYISFEIPITWDGFPSYRARLNGHLENNLGKTVAYSEAVQDTANGFDNEQPGLEKQQSTAQNNAKINKEIIDPYNAEVTKANTALPKVEAIINTTKGDDYVTQRDLLRKYNIAGLENNFKTFYLNEKLTRWDSRLGSANPYKEYLAKEQAQKDFDILNGDYTPEAQELRDRYKINDFQGTYDNLESYVIEQLRTEKPDASEEDLGAEARAILEKSDKVIGAPEAEEIRKKYGIDAAKQIPSQVYSTILDGVREDTGYGFDAAHYKTQAPEAARVWQEAVDNDDLDVIGRYVTEGTYLHYHYTTQGKQAGLRANPNEITEQANAYVETKPTDQDKQNLRDLQLGIDTNTQTQRLLNIPEIAVEWEKAKKGDEYWKQQGKEKFLDVTKPDEFVVLFRLSERPEDKQVVFARNLDAALPYGITELEDALNQAIGEKTSIDVKRFGALAQDVLRETIEEMKQAKGKEEMLDLLSGFGGFSEIVNINQTLTNSILGDTGVGGILSFTSAGKAEESLEKSLQGITGVNNNATYNWQQWFDNELKQRYQDDLELGFTTSEAADKIKIEGEFARQFIDDYLIPRFNTSRSMDEFVEYIDIRQEEQTPFTTQDLQNAVKSVAEAKAKFYLDEINKADDRYFNADFYFNPSGNKLREADFIEQAKTISEDWEAAKEGDAYWNAQAYRFGVDVNDKEAFAKMHFEIKGQGRGYDAADDILNASKTSDYIFNTIMPALKEEALQQGTVFGLFVTPEEFADEVLQGLDPSDKTTWEETLQRYGLTDFKGTVDELKEYIVETLRTGSAQDIREQIKYLNEKRQRPTQEKLGITYIERPEDYKDELAKSETQMYKIFQDAGFQGTEDEFYENFFPDVDRSEQILLTKAGSDKGLEMYNLDLSDPFASLGTIEGFFEEDKTLQDKSDKSDESSFFSLGLSDDDDDYKSKTGETILGEFTSMFKGL